MILKHISLVLALGTALYAPAQLPSIGAQIDQDFLREAIAPAVKVVRTTYFMADVAMTQRYSASADSVFGYDYSLAYQTPDGFIVSGGTLNPWQTDPQFEEFRNSEEYTPLLNNRAYATLTDAPVYEQLAIDPLNVLDQPIGKDTGLAWWKSGNTPAGHMMTATDSTAGDKGFMAWFILPRDRNLQEFTDLNIKFTRHTPEYGDNGVSSITALPATGGTLIGGLYIIPRPHDNGTVTLRIGGVLSRTTPHSSSWRLVRVGHPSTPWVSDDDAPVRDNTAPAGTRTDSGTDDDVPADTARPEKLKNKLKAVKD